MSLEAEQKPGRKCNYCGYQNVSGRKYCRGCARPVDLELIAAEKAQRAAVTAAATSSTSLHATSTVPSVKSESALTARAEAPSSPWGDLIQGTETSSSPTTVALAPSVPALSKESAPSPAAARPATSRLALASLGFGLISIFAPAGILAVLFGHAAHIQIARNPRNYGGKNVAWLGAIFGYLGLAVFAGLLLVTTHRVHMPRIQWMKSGAQVASTYDPLLRSMKNRPVMASSAREAEVLDALKQITDSESKVRSSNPTRGFTCSLPELFDSGLSDDFGDVSTRTGYAISLRDCVRDARTAAVIAYRVYAVPPPGTGDRVLCTDQGGMPKALKTTEPETCFSSGEVLSH